MRKRVYVAGPISHGDLAHNIKQAEDAGFALMRAGIAAWVPHWSCYSTGPVREPLGSVYAKATAFGGGAGIGHAEWLETDLAWVAVADGVLRLPGVSVGADMEVAEAQYRGIPVFNSVEEVLACFGSSQS